MTDVPYTAKSLSGAQRRVRELLKQRKELMADLQRLDQHLNNFLKERIMLAKLAAKGPAFDNPLVAFEAEQIRDDILRRVGLAPDGKFLPKGRAS